jgi:hypothetical protein
LPVSETFCYSQSAAAGEAAQGDEAVIKVSAEKLEPGMILAQKIERADGIMLSNKGAELTPSLISTIRRMDMEFVLIEGDAFASEEERQAHLQGLLNELDARFSRVVEDPILNHLKELFAEKIRQSGQ